MSAAAGYGGGVSDPGVGAGASTRGGPLPPVAGPTQAQAAALMAQRRRLSAPGAVGAEAAVSGGGGARRSLSGGRAVAAAERGRQPLRQVTDAGNVKRGRSAAGVERERGSDGGRRASSAAGAVGLACGNAVWCGTGLSLQPTPRQGPGYAGTVVAQGVSPFWMDWSNPQPIMHCPGTRCRRCGGPQRCDLPGPSRFPAGGPTDPSAAVPNRAIVLLAAGVAGPSGAASLAHRAARLVAAAEALSGGVADTQALLSPRTKLLQVGRAACVW